MKGRGMHIPREILSTKELSWGEKDYQEKSEEIMFYVAWALLEENEDTKKWQNINWKKESAIVEK